MGIHCDYDSERNSTPWSSACPWHSASPWHRNATAAGHASTFGDSSRWWKFNEPVSIAVTDAVQTAMSFSTIEFYPGPRVASIVLNRPPPER